VARQANQGRENLTAGLRADSAPQLYGHALAQEVAFRPLSSLACCSVTCYTFALSHHLAFPYYIRCLPWQDLCGAFDFPHAKDRHRQTLTAVTGATNGITRIPMPLTTCCHGGASGACATSQRRVSRLASPAWPPVDIA